MSVIAVKIGKNIEFATDSAIMYPTEGGDSEVLVSESPILSKVVRSEFIPLLIGSTGNILETQILDKFLLGGYTCSPTKQSVFDFMTRFSEFKRKTTDDGTIRNHSIFWFQSEDEVVVTQRMSVLKPADYAAIGSGFQFAMAALHLGHSAREAVQVAIDLNPYCAGPVVSYL